MAIALYKKLQELRINIQVKNGQLDVQAPKGVLNDGLLDEIRLHKHELMEVIAAYRKQKELHQAIPATNPRTYYPLSSPQRRLWVLSQLAEGNIAYNISRVFVFEGKLDPTALQYAFDRLLERHESLRTTFREDDEGNIGQVVCDAGILRCRIYDYDLRQNQHPEESARHQMQQEGNQPFDLVNGPLLRAALFRLADARWLFTFTIHHIISDGWSMNILIRELMDFYSAYSRGNTPSPAPLRIHYKDYAAWQQHQLETGALEAHRQYWLQQLKGELPLLELPYDKARPSVKTYNGGIVTRQVPAALYTTLLRFNKEQGGSLFMSLLAVINALLFRYTGQEDIITGHPIAGREHADLENQVGFYLNALTLRTPVHGHDSFYDLYARVRQLTLAAYEHQAYPFDELLQQLNLQRDKSRNPLFDVFIDLQMAGTGSTTAQPGELQVKGYESIEHTISKFDLTFLFIEQEGQLQLLLEYNSDLFGHSTAERMAVHFEGLLKAALQSPGQPLAQLQYLGAEEKQQLLVSFNTVPQQHTGYRSVLTLWQEQVAAHPHHAAILYGGVSFTYQQLDEQSGKLAAYLLQEYQVSTGSRIGLLVDRSEKMIVAILGILKAGCAYVPIDTAYPNSRIQYIVRDSALQVLITETTWLFNLGEYTGQIFSIDVQLDTLPPAATFQPATMDATALAYVMYTSGSTGLPKGCAITHGGLSNYVQWANHFYFPDATPANFGLFTSLSFDLTVTSIFCSLTTGGTLTIFRQEQPVEEILRDYFREDSGLNSIKLTPSHINLLSHLHLKSNSVLRAVVGGEQLTQQQVRTLKRIHPAIKIFNEYGPTEATVGCVVKLLEEGEPVLIGRPIAQTRIYIVDQEQQLCPIGVAGQLYIGGAGLAAGYWNNAELTAEKFVADPFQAGERLYRTGDLGRWLADGNIEFLGRTDDQVKVRGYRIEPEEISSVLQRHDAISDAAVLARQNEQGEQYLVAYFVSDTPLEVVSLRQYLATQLPAYMVPAHFIQLGKIPLTTNGKLDKKALPDPEGAALPADTAYEAPRTEEERILVTVCEEVLKKQPVGIRDDFFVLGGDSIKSIQVVARLKQRGFTLGVQDVLLHPLLEELAGRMSRSVRAISQETVEGMIPLSPVQHWFFSNGSAHKHHYNQSVLLRSRERLSAAGIRAALEELVLHHDALRMVYRPTAEGWEQENRGADQKYSFEVLEDVAASDLNGHCDRLQAGIHLAEGPLVHACLFKGAAEDRLLIVIHHLVTDGVSWRILLEDLGTLYEQYVTGAALVLPEKTDSFRYWQEQQLHYSVSDALKNEEAWWSQLEAGTYAPLPTDHREGSNLEADRTACSFLLDEQLTEQLMTRCYQAYHTTINDILLTALGLAVSSLMGGEQLLISLEGHGREELDGAVDVSRTVGWFTTMYPVVLDMRHKEDRIRQLLTIKEHLHRVPNKGIGYGILRYLGGKPYRLQPSISFNYLGDFGDGSTGGRHHPLGELSGESQGRNISGDWVRDALLDVTGITVAGRLRLSVSYSRQQYEAERIEQLTGAYQQELEKLILELSSLTGEYQTPVDLTWKGLSLDQWEALNAAGDIEDVYPLSPLQEGLYYQWLMQPQGSAYFEQMSYRVEGVVDVALLGRSYEELVKRHGVLRTSFTREYGERPLQIIRKGERGSFAYLDKSEDAQFSIESFRAADRRQGFDLHRGSQMRLQLIRLGEGSYEFVWSHHHILMDGWCVSILIKEFFEIYHSLQEGRVPVLAPVHPYSKYIEWLSTQDQEGSLSYWKNYLAGYDTLSVLPKKEGVTGKSFLSQTTGLILDEDLREAVRTLCTGLSVTESTFLQVAWGILLARYNNTSDVVFGAVVSGRPAALKGVEDMIGMFINTIPVRITVNENSTVSELLKATQQVSIEHVDYRYLQLGNLREAALPGKELFDHIILFENFPMQQLVEQSMPEAGAGSALTMTAFNVYGQNNFDFTVMANPAETFSIRFDYNANVYAEDTVQRVSDHLLQVIQQMVNNPSLGVKDISCLNAEEQYKVLHSWNHIVPNYTGYRSVISLFEEQAARNPERSAITFGNTSVSYRHLHEQAGKLASFLVTTCNVQAGDRVGIMLERSGFMIISILGVLMSGAAYVPVDPEYPKARREYLLQDAACDVLLTQSEYLYDLDFYQGTLVAMDLQMDGMPAQAVRASAVEADSLAYVIYTSGSTGKPKGCAITHGSLSNYIQWANNYYFNIGQPANFGLFTSLSFDLTVTSLFCTLTQGGNITIYPQQQELTSILTHSFQAASGINSIKLTPSHILLMKYLPLTSNTLQRAIVGGEQLTAEQVNILKNINPKIEIYNEYGPTEATVGCVVTRIDQGQPVIIGRPIAHTFIYILSNDLHPAPVGIPGEICIGGAGLANGYFNNPELTAAKFLPNPFRPGEKMYRTGDLGKWLPNGNLVFIGRKDAQVKIRGYRVEPGEIETILQKAEGVDAAIVWPVTNSNGDQELIACITGMRTLEITDLRTWLLTQLPAYMLPAHIIQLPEFPLTPNGKIDRSRLPAPDGLNSAASQHYESPRNEIEAQLVQIWQELLGRDVIGITDNFFDIGGNSIRIVRLAGQVSNLLGREVSVALLFEYPSIKDLVDHIMQETVPLTEESSGQEELIGAFNKFNQE